MQGQSAWVYIVLAFLGPGAGATLLLWLLSRRVENVKADAIKTTSDVEKFDMFTTKQNEWITRLEAELVEERALRTAAEKEVRRLRRAPKARGSE